jgi:hypothetical protein
VRNGADRRLVAGAVTGGVGFDIAARSGLATIAGTAWVAVAATAILLAGRGRGLASRLCIGAAPALGLILTFRSSPWVIAPVTLAITGILILGVSLGADCGGPGGTFPEVSSRMAIAAGHLALAPGVFRSHGEQPPGGIARRRAAALARGALLGVPVMIVVGVLLAVADPIFASWLDLSAVPGHLVLAVIGAWAVAGLLRGLSAVRPSPALPPAPSLGTVEAACVLSGLCALYAAFVSAQFVALSGAGRHILVTQGLTYAQYARSGFFELLACAAITLLVLLGVRACTSPAQPLLAALSGLTVALTIGIMVVAIRRLELYEAEFGLTMLRLACLVSAAWIGIVFVLLGCTLWRRGLPGRLFPAAVIVSGLVVVGAWGAANPAAIVARTNLHRAEHGQSFDVGHAASLGPDAMPALLAGARYLPSAQATGLRYVICARSAGKHDGLAFNVSRFSAGNALAQACDVAG